MTFFTRSEFNNKYSSLGTSLGTDQEVLIEMACEMIYSQLGLMYRGNLADIEVQEPPRGVRTEDNNGVPKAIKNASMEQCRFMLEHDIPFLDNRGELKAGNMTSDLKTDYSTLALRILANAGYLYRGNPINTNMGMKVSF